MLPIGVEDFRYLSHAMGLACNDAVVAGQREILNTQIKGGDKRSRPVHNHRLLMCDIKLGAGPLDIYPSALQFLESFVIGPVTARSFRVEHDPHIDASSLPIDDRFNERVFGKRKL